MELSIETLWLLMKLIVSTAKRLMVTDAEHLVVKSPTSPMHGESGRWLMAQGAILV